jgi:hypothetical protein
MRATGKFQRKLRKFASSINFIVAKRLLLQALHSTSFTFFLLPSPTLTIDKEIARHWAQQRDLLIEW